MVSFSSNYKALNLQEDQFYCPRQENFKLDSPKPKGSKGKRRKGKFELEHASIEMYYTKLKLNILDKEC